MAEHWILAVGDADHLRDATSARYETGSFAPCGSDDPWSRQVEIGDGFVRELGDQLGQRDFLARTLAEATREPVILQWPDSERAYELAPGDDPAAPLREVDRRPPPSLAVHRLFYTLDLHAQREIERAFEADLERRITAQFPLQNRRKTARIDCRKIKAYGPRTSPTVIRRYDRYLQTELQLALFEWSDDGNDRSLTDRRSSTVTLGSYDLLTPSGHVVRNGEEIQVPYDEYAAEFHAAMTRYLRRIQLALERTDWTGVTPGSLFDQ